MTQLMKKQERKELTAATALKICLEMWLWIANNPIPNTIQSDSYSKIKWPKWKSLFKKYGRFIHYCPCCEFQRRQNKESHRNFECQRNKCLLAGFAWNKTPMACSWQASSPFIKWWNSWYSHGSDTKCPTKERKLRVRCAIKIANACSKALYKLEHKKG